MQKVETNLGSAWVPGSGDTLVFSVESQRQITASPLAYIENLNTVAARASDASGVYTKNARYALETAVAPITRYAPSCIPLSVKPNISSIQPIPSDAPYPMSQAK